MELNQCLEEIKNIIDDVVNNTVTTQRINVIPDSKDIPLEKNHCLELDQVTCVFIDMVGSTRMSLPSERSVKVYDMFIKSLVKILDIYGAQYIDIKGDGAFGLFSDADSAIPALCAAITFHTICERTMQNKFSAFPIKMHAGIDTDKVFVKRIGLRGDKNNEVWIGKPVNIASKLASLANQNEILVSDRAYKILNQSQYERYLLYSCGCNEETSSYLWKKYPNNHPFLNLENYYCLTSYWCPEHGNQYCNNVMDIYRKKKN